MEQYKTDFEELCFNFIKLDGVEEEIPLYHKSIKIKCQEEDVISVCWINKEWVCRYIISDAIKEDVLSVYNDDQINIMIYEYIDRLDPSKWSFIITGRNYKHSSLLALKKLFKKK